MSETRLTDITAPRTRRRHRTGAAVVAVCALLLSLLSACSSGSVPQAPTAGQLRTLLRAHGTAVLHRDRSAFVAGIADGDTSKAYRSAQTAAFANLSQLRFSTWSYRLDGPTDDRSAARSATRVFGRPAVVYRVTLSYRLTGYDPRPTSRTLYWTFVRDGDHAVIAGDSTLARSGGASWKGPWDFGPLVVGRGTSALVLAHSSAGDLSALVREVDASVPAVTAVWGTDWPRKAVVLVPGSQDEFDADTVSAPETSSKVAAVTVADGTDPTSGAAFGVRLVVQPRVLDTLSALGRQITLRHELTHVATAAVTSDATPRWLVEGFADYVGQLDSGQPVTTAAAELTKTVRAGQLPTALPDDAAFESSATVGQAYEGSWLACRLIAQQAGQAALVRLYRAVSGQGDYTTALGTGLRTVLNTTQAAFVSRWRAYLRSELG